MSAPLAKQYSSSVSHLLAPSLDKLVFGRYCVDKTGAAIDVEAAALDWLITDTRKVLPEFDHPKHQAIRSLFNGK